MAGKEKVAAGVGRVQPAEVWFDSQNQRQQLERSPIIRLQGVLGISENDLRFFCSPNGGLHPSSGAARFIGS